MQAQALIRSLARPLLTLLLGAAMVACGGDSYDAEPPPPAADATVPASAIATPRAYTSFAGSLSADDRARPLELGAWTAPTSETDAPEPVR